MQKKKQENYLIFVYKSVVIAKRIKRKIILEILGEEIGLLFQLADDFLDLKDLKNCW